LAIGFVAVAADSALLAGEPFFGGAFFALSGPSLLLVAGLLADVPVGDDPVDSADASSMKADFCGFDSAGGGADAWGAAFAGGTCDALANRSQPVFKRVSPKAAKAIAIRKTFSFRVHGDCCADGGELMECSPDAGASGMGRCVAGCCFGVKAVEDVFEM
jgi:hypothetical protein